jgi:hypothetical protein
MPSWAQSCFLVTMPASSNRSLRLLSLAEKRTHWPMIYADPVSRTCALFGMPAESVFALVRNDRSASPGITVRLAPESVSALVRNTHDVVAIVPVPTRCLGDEEEVLKFLHLLRQSIRFRHGRSSTRSNDVALSGRPHAASGRGTPIAGRSSPTPG